MKKVNLLLVLVLAAAIYTFQQCSKPQEAYTASAIDSCLASPSWFPHTQTPPPNEGASSPFGDPNTTSNCNFHQWSWQKFLYLTRTSSDNGKLNFENLVQVDNQMSPVSSTMLVLSDSSQAGTGSVLLDKKNRAVYYAIYIDSSMFHFANTYADLFVKNCRSGSTLDPAKMKSLGYDTLTYPVGSFEVKTSWILVSSLPSDEVADYYVSEALLNNKKTDVALLGMHIVGRVINHPEFIWATFDHANLAPTVKWPANILTDSIPDPTQILSTSDAVFYNANLPMNACSITKSAGSTAPFQSTYHLFDHGTQPEYQNILPHLRTQDSTNLANINMINNDVATKLNAESGPWKNYYYFGSIWIDPTTSTLQPGDANIGSLWAANLRGSRALSNVTMETYIQALSTPPTPTKSFNCFGCHGTVNFKITGAGADYNLALSHLFNNYLGDKLGNKRNPDKKNEKYVLGLPE